MKITIGCVLLLALMLGCRNTGESPALVLSELPPLPRNVEVEASGTEQSSAEESWDPEHTEYLEHMQQANSSGSEPVVDAEADPILVQAIGLTEDGARRLAALKGKTFQVARVDGKYQPVLADINPNRMSVEIRKGIVVRAVWGN